MLENFEIAVKGGKQYMMKDFAVLGTQSTSHPGNLKVLGNMQIFFRHDSLSSLPASRLENHLTASQFYFVSRLNTQRRFQELDEDLNGTMLHLKGTT